MTRYFGYFPILSPLLNFLSWRGIYKILGRFFESSFPSNSCPSFLPYRSIFPSKLLPVIRLVFQNLPYHSAEPILLRSNLYSDERTGFFLPTRRALEIFFTRTYPRIFTSIFKFTMPRWKSAGKEKACETRFRAR